MFSAIYAVVNGFGCVTSLNRAAVMSWVLLKNVTKSH